MKLLCFNISEKRFLEFYEFRLIRKGKVIDAVIGGGREKECLSAVIGRPISKKILLAVQNN